MGVKSTIWVSCLLQAQRRHGAKTRFGPAQFAPIDDPHWATVRPSVTSRRPLLRQNPSPPYDSTRRSKRAWGPTILVVADLDAAVSHID
jgi:hypothetical protein